MDAHTLALLEFDKIRGLLADEASSDLGKEKARAIDALVDVGAINALHRRTAEMMDALESRLDPPLGGLRDIRQTIRRAELGVMLDVEQILSVRDVSELSGRVVDFRERLGVDYPDLVALLTGVHDGRPLARQIDRDVDSRGTVRDTASVELAKIRRELAEVEQRIQNELRRLLRQPEIKKALRFPQSTMSGPHHVLPVAVNYRHLVVGVVHRASSTGETLYVEPAKVAEIAAGAALVRNAEEREIRRVLRRITSSIGEHAKALAGSLEILSELDLARAKARYALAFRMIAPRVVETGPLRLVNARHPILEHLFRNESASPKRRAVGDEAGEANPARASESPSIDSSRRQVVPITVELGGAFDLLIITGPNTGGKTVALKTVGLLTVMALAGIPIPAGPGSQVPLLRQVLADIGDEQSLEQSLSTFSSHVTRIGQILRSCGPDTLVLLDEMGAGTEPSEGSALGRAILDELVLSGSRAMVTTHLGDLKMFAFSRDRAENAAMQFDSRTLQPTYQLILGQFGQSCALKIARRLELPKPLLKRAHKYLRRRAHRSGRELTELQRLRQEAIEAKAQADQAREVAEQAEADFRRRTQQLRQEADVSAELEKARQALAPGDVVRVARFDKQGTIVRVDRRRGHAAVNVGAVEWQIPLEEIIPIPRA